MKKYLASLGIAVTLISSLGASAAFADTPYQFHIDTTPDIGGNYTSTFDVDTNDFSNGYLFGIQKADHATAMIKAGSGLVFSGNQLNVDGVDQTHISGLSEVLSNKASTSTVNALATRMTNAENNIGALHRTEQVRAQTNTSGIYTWTFETPLPTGQLPIVMAVAEDATTGAMSNVQITAISNTSVTIQTRRITSVLGILGLNTTPQLYVDLVAVSP